MTEHTTKLDAVGTNGCKVTTETLHAQPAAPPAPTMYECHKHGAVAGDHCPQCRVVAYVDVSNAPDTRPAEAQEPLGLTPGCGKDGHVGHEPTHAGDTGYCATCEKEAQEPKAQEYEATADDCAAGLRRMAGEVK